MRLREALSVLSKSSPYAVKTSKQSSELTEKLDEVKEYLYIRTDIEDDFLQVLTSVIDSDEKKVIFLSGSSGDGKSEILTRYNQQFETKAQFHLDATHSLSPKETAIERLDILFNEYDTKETSLVVGINTGMLANYAEEGSHTETKTAIKGHLNKSIDSPGYVFLDFESYPKFKLNKDSYTSDFTEKLLKRITEESDNPIFEIYKEEMNRSDSDSLLCLNYSLLSLPAVQKIVVDSLFKARLIKDQFLTARALLDFVHHLLMGHNLLSDNLFSSQDNEIVKKITDFDPALLRTKTIDEFILSFKLDIIEGNYKAFRVSMQDQGYDLRKLQTPESMIRLFYLLQGEELGNNYHHQFKSEFNDKLLDKYAKLWRLHQTPDDADAKKQLRDFYRDTLLNALVKYNNRNAPHLGKEFFLLGTRGDYHIAASLELKQDYSAIKTIAEKNNSENVDYFNAYLKLDDEPLRPIPVSINLLNLLYRISEGYQPNKHDKNAVVILDELVEHLHEVAHKSQKLLVIGDQKRYQVNDAERDGTELEVMEV
jgi:DNA phosphorothioation-dependent restriction protein DptF